VVTVIWRPASWYGNLSTVARVDTADAVAEGDETDNELRANTQVVRPPLPDLLVDSIAFVPSPPVQNRDNEVRITIRNAGGQATGAFGWEWQPGSATPYTGLHEGLAAGESDVVTVNWHPASWYGNLPTAARVDTADAVTESDESNNERQQNTEVVRPP
jgi:subtilase family serine protease